MAKSPKKSLSLEKSCLAVVNGLPESEYMIERHTIVKGEDYRDIVVSAKWADGSESVNVSVTFIVTADQQENMQGYLDDDDVRDDIDSAIGEIFESALQGEYPDYNMRSPVGSVTMKCKKKK